MIRQWIQTSPFETLEQVVDRALTKASETGVPILFVFQDSQYEASPAPPGIGTVQMLAERWEEPEANKQAKAAIMMCTRSIVQDWTVEVIFAEVIIEGKGGYVLVAGETVNYLGEIKYRLCERLISDNPAHILEASRRRIVIRDGPTVIFETYTDSNAFRGMQFEVAFLQEDERKVMGGNYNEFPWVDKGRSSWE